MFRDLRRENAAAEQFKAILAAEIIKTLDWEHLNRLGSRGEVKVRVRRAEPAAREAVPQ